MFNTTKQPSVLPKEVSSLKINKFKRIEIDPTLEKLMNSSSEILSNNLKRINFRLRKET